MRIETFASKPSLYFHSGYNSLAEGGNQTGSLSYSFFYTESTLTEDILWVDVRLTGDPSHQARAVKHGR